MSSSLFTIIVLAGPLVLFGFLLIIWQQLWEKYFGPRSLLKKLKMKQPVEITQARRRTLKNYADKLKAKGKLTVEEEKLVRKYILFSRATS